MFESKFKPNLQKREQGEFEAVSLETVQLSEIPMHEGVRKEVKVEIAKKIVRIEELKKGASPKFENEKRILQAGLQNIVAQELLSQEGGPMSLSRRDFKDFIAKQNEDLAEEYFGNKEWNGMTTVTRSVELDLRAEDDLSNKEVIFCDLLDANDATDYIIAGMNTDADEPRYTFKLVQAGTLDGDKSQSYIKNQHESLARRLSNETSPEKVFQNNREDILALIGNVAENLSDVEVSTQSMVEILLDKNFSLNEKSKSFNDIDILEDFTANERQLFTDDFEKLIYFAQQDFTSESREELIQEIIDDHGVNKSTVENLVLLISDTFNTPDLLQAIPVDFVSRTMIRFKNDRFSEKDIPLDGVDSNLVPMYCVDELELSNIFKANTHGKNKRDEAA